MNGLPVYLAQGLISVYSQPNLWGIFGIGTIYPNNQQSGSNIEFGVINQSNWGSASLAIGDQVMYDKTKVIAPISYQDQNYYILNGNDVISTLYVYNIPPAP